MCANKSKTFEEVVTFDDLYKKIEALQSENATLEQDVCDLERQVELFHKEAIRMEDLYNVERKQRVEAKKSCIDLEEEVNRLTARLDASKELRAVEARKRHASIPKFVIASAVALAALIVPYTLHQMAAIGPQVAFTTECALMMIIAWCYAIIWDRSRK